MPRQATSSGARVLVADDHPLMRAALRRVMTSAGLEVVAEVADGDAAVHAALELRPEIALLDVMMPGIGGLEATRRIASACPEVRVVAISGFPGAHGATAAQRAGAAAFILKGAGAAEIVGILRAVRDGRPYDGPREVGMTLGPAATLPPDNSPADAVGKLTRREREVLRLVAQEHSSAGVARVLHLSARTVETHRRNIMTKLGIHSVAGLTRFAIENGLV